MLRGVGAWVRFADTSADSTEASNLSSSVLDIEHPRTSNNNLEVADPIRPWESVFDMEFWHGSDNTHVDDKLKVHPPIQNEVSSEVFGQISSPQKKTSVHDRPTILVPSSTCIATRYRCSPTTDSLPVNRGY